MTTGLLYSQSVIAAGAAPTQTAIFMHGLFGSGEDWRSVAVNLVQRRPDWAVELVDLRLHGKSRDLTPPHTMEACAEDVRRFMNEKLGTSARAVVGLSFSGKIALRLAEDRPCHLKQAWAVDSSLEPTTFHGEGWRMVAALQAVGATFLSYEDAIRKLTSQGLSEPRATWLARNLCQDKQEVSWQWALDHLIQLRDEYVQWDLLRVLHKNEETSPDIHIIRADDSGIITDEALGRIEAATKINPKVHLHRLAGRHVLHRTNPQGIAKLLAEKLPWS